MIDVKPVQSWDIAATNQTFVDGTFHGVVMGVEIQKCDDDLLRYRDAVEYSRPDVIIETGTRAGGSALWFHKELGLEVISIDVSPQFTRGEPYRGPGIQWIRGSSIDLGVVKHVLPLITGKRVMVSLDADHHSPHVQAEMATWAPYVSPGCYLVVEDGCFDMFHRSGMPDRARIGGSKIPEIGGPMHAIERSSIAMSYGWARDEDLEALTPVSHSPGGWWCRADVEVRR